MGKTYEILDWDSRFFELKVGKLEHNVLQKQDIQAVFDELEAEEIDLVYYYSDEPLEGKVSGNYEVILVDKKVPLKKNLKVAEKLHPAISFYNCDKPNDDLIELAQLAGIHTRFKVDPNISEELYNNLFRVWIEKSVDGTMASKVLVYKKYEEIVGFGTVKINGEEGQAPLFAVKRKNEGTGISFALMEALESYMAKKGCKYVITSTQETNRKALKVYERYGLEIQKKIYVYHLWRKLRN